MAVRIIESLDPDTLAIKKMSIDGMKNTIKYEITLSISFDVNKKLTAEAELHNALQLYSAQTEDISVTLKSVSTDALKLAIEVPRSNELHSQDVATILEDILSECEYIRY